MCFVAEMLALSSSCSFDRLHGAMNVTAFVIVKTVMAPKVMIFATKSFQRYSFLFVLFLFFFCGGGQANTQNVTHNIDQFVTVSLCNLDSVFRNDTTRVIQPEVIYRSDTLGQASSNTIAGSSSGVDRKGSVAIGQSIFYTEDPPQDFGNSGKGHNSKFIIIQLTFNRTFAIFVEWKTCSNRNES